MPADTKPEWEVAWERENPGLVGRMDRGGELSDYALRERAGFKYGFLAAQAQQEAAIRAARTGLLEEIRAAANKEAETRTLYADCLEDAFDAAWEKYADPAPPEKGPTDG